MQPDLLSIKLSNGFTFDMIKVEGGVFGWGMIIANTTMKNQPTRWSWILFTSENTPSRRDFGRR
ncbi:MAG: hypothetical protein WA004_00150 [Saprospiraceae bacterium]